MRRAQVLEMATIQGARDCHLGQKIGTLTPGKDAESRRLGKWFFRGYQFFLAGSPI